MGNIFSYCCFLSRNHDVEGGDVQTGPTGDSPQNVGLSRSQKRRAKKKAKQAQISETSPLLKNTASVESLTEQAEPGGSTNPDISAYIQHARHEESKSMTVKNFKSLADCWNAVVQSLNSDVPQNPNTLGNGHYLSLANLRLMKRAPKPDEIIQHLLLLAEPRAPRLVDVTRYHLKSYRSGSLSSTTTMSNTYIYHGQRKYKAPTLFAALHWIFVETLPPNRPLKEYLQMYLLIQPLLSRFFQQFTPEHSAEIPNKISLLVILPASNGAGGPISRAAIGFSATIKARGEIIGGRHERLKELEVVKQHHYEYELGNCAEVETYAWFKDALPDYRGGKVVAVTSTLNLLEGTPEAMCGQCKDLAAEIRTRSPGAFTLDLRPFKEKANAVQSPRIQLQGCN